MKSALLALVASLSMSVVSYAEELHFLSFHGKAAIEQLKSGAVKSTARLGDRTLPPASYKVGQVIPLVNGDRNEDPRKFAEQIAANAYGKAEFKSIRVAQFDTLSAAEKAEFLKYYTPEKIKEAKGIVSILGIQYKN